MPELLALGAPDRRLAVLPRLYEQLLEDSETLRVGLPHGLTPGEHQRLRDLRPRVAALCERLAGYRIAETIAHEEIYDGNVMVGHGRYIFFDWGDSSVGHPFFSWLVTLRLPAQVAGRRAGDLRLRDLYLAPWRRFGSRENLLTALRLAYRLGMVNRALSWHRILAPLPPQHKAPDADAVSGWLQDFLNAEAKAGD